MSDYKFSTKFLDHLKNGLQLDRPQTPRGEFEILIRSFNECLLYLVVNLKLIPLAHAAFIQHAVDMVRGEGGSEGGEGKEALL